MFAFLSGLLINYLGLCSKWPLMLLVILFAPFYEWYAHKFILHKELTKKDSWFREFQINLHHGHNAKPEDTT